MGRSLYSVYYTDFLKIKIGEKIGQSYPKIEKREFQFTFIPYSVDKLTHAYISQSINKLLS